ncbi:uncharacterized protein EV422DRAFT_532389 [Fimicolochytrium jonesii]|uniref:uncharacterized protein n=1 Tax=Fimicolochytrium jonesii TaxID=1396493 RepID=UPI0022FE5C8A|nr:uncharacterized protein EV422DRAFT_532389 [Fimicolochytrium jonesii]KAI8819823.1 hypothetical protein EV422DRAFT_532389 [Fimicolochytrium jonesii]
MPANTDATATRRRSARLTSGSAAADKPENAVGGVRVAANTPRKKAARLTPQSSPEVKRAGKGGARWKKEERVGVKASSSPLPMELSVERNAHDGGPASRAAERLEIMLNKPVSEAQPSDDDDDFNDDDTVADMLKDPRAIFLEYLSSAPEPFVPSPSRTSAKKKRSGETIKADQRSKRQRLDATVARDPGWDVDDGSDDSDECGDKTLQIPGEAVLAFFADDRRYYPARVESFNPSTGKYKLTFGLGYSRSLPRHKFHTPFDPEFHKVEVGDVSKSLSEDRAPSADYEDPELLSEFTAVLPDIRELVDGPISAHRRCELFFDGDIKALEIGLRTGPMDVDQTELIVRTCKKELFGLVERESEEGESKLKDTEQPKTRPRRNRIKSSADGNEGDPEISSTPQSAKDPLSQESLRSLDASSDTTDTRESCALPSPPASHEASAISLLASDASRTDKFVRLVLIPETAIRILMLRSSKDTTTPASFQKASQPHTIPASQRSGARAPSQGPLSYTAAEELLYQSATVRKMDFIERVMSARECVVLGRAVRDNNRAKFRK